MRRRCVRCLIMVPLALGFACTGTIIEDGAGGEFSIDAYPALVSTTPITITGTRPSGTAIHVDATEAMAAGSSQTWLWSLDLSEGANEFLVEAVDSQGQTQGSQTVSITLDTTPPSVISQTPAPDATDVPMNSNVEVGFSEPVDCATVTDAVFAIQGVATTIDCRQGEPSIALDPTADLAPSTQFMVTLFSDVKDPAGNALPTDVVWRFTTGTVIDNIPPDPPTADNPAPPVFASQDSVLVGGWKEAGASVIANGTEIVPKDALDTWSHNFALVAGANAFSLTSEDAAGNVSLTSTDFTITRLAGQFGLDPYPAVVNASPLRVTGVKPDGAAVRMDGNEVVAAGPATTWSHDLALSEGPNSFLFEATDPTGAVIGSETANVSLDTVVPGVSTTLPMDQATGVATNVTVQVTFSEAVDCATITPATLFLTGVTGTVNCTAGNPSVTMTPSTALASMTSYQGTVSATVADPAGNTLGADFTWSFTTGGSDTTPPAPPTADNPAPPQYILAATVQVGGWKEAGSSVIADSTEVVAKDPLDYWSFDFPLVLGDNDVSLTSEDAAGNVSLTSTDFSVIRPDGSFSIDAYPALVNATPLAISGNKPEGYAVWIDGSEAVAASPVMTWNTSLVLSEGANSFSVDTRDPTGAVADSDTVTVTLDTMPPTIVQTSPADTAIDVPINTTVQVELSEALDCATVTVAAFAITGVSSQLTCVAGNPTISLTPDADLAGDTTFQVTLAATVADPAGNALGADATWSFTTTDTADTTPPLPPTIDNPAPPQYHLPATVLVGGSKEAGSSVISGAGTIVPKDPLATWSFAFPLVVGSNPFSLTSEDAAGNVSLTSTDFTVIRPNGSFSIDAYPPLVNSTPYNINGTKPEGYSIRVDGSQVVAAGPAMVWNTDLSLSEGANSFVVDTRDPSGAIADQGNVDITLDSGNPSITQRTPGPDATDVAVNTNVTVQFNEPLDCTTVNPSSFFITGVTGSVSCTVGNPTITLNPTSNLAELTTYQVTVDGTVADPAGNTLGSASNWSFTTEDNTPPAPPTADNPAPPASTMNPTVTVGGSKEAGSSVISNLAEVVPKNGSATWQFDFALSMGNNNFSLTSEDAAGNVSLTSTDFSVTRLSNVTVPTLDPVYTPTTVGNQVLTGTKGANTSVWNGGIELVPRDSSTSWDALVYLTSGDNDFTLTAKDAGDVESAPAPTQTIVYNQPSRVANGGQLRFDFDVHDIWNYIGDELHAGDGGDKINHHAVDIWIEGPITPGEACIFDTATKQRKHTRYRATLVHGCGQANLTQPCGWWGEPNYRSPNFLAALIEWGQWAGAPEPIDPDCQRRDPATGYRWPGTHSNGWPDHPELYYRFWTSCCGWVARLKMYQGPNIDGVTEASIDSGQHGIPTPTGPALGTWKDSRTYTWDLREAGTNNLVRRGPYLVNITFTVDRAGAVKPHYPDFLESDRETCWDDVSQEDEGTHRAEGIIMLGTAAETIYLQEEGHGVVDSCKWTDIPATNPPNRVKCNCQAGDFWPCMAEPIEDPSLLGGPVRLANPDKYVNPIGDGYNYAVRVQFTP